MTSLIRFYPLIDSDRLFDDVFSTRLWPCTSSAEGCQPPRVHPIDSFRPKLDLHEAKDSNVVTATFEFPGLTSENVIIDMYHNRLTVSGESGTSSSQEEDGYAVRERRYGKFSRVVQLPFGTKPEDVKARMENGILTVTFPKAGPEQQPQRIAIQ